MPSHDVRALALKGETGWRASCLGVERRCRSGGEGWGCRGRHDRQRGVFKREGFCPPFILSIPFFGDFFCDAVVFDRSAPCASPCSLPISAVHDTRSAPRTRVQHSDAGHRRGGAARRRASVAIGASGCLRRMDHLGVRLRSVRYDGSIFAGAAIPGGWGALVWSFLTYATLHGDLTHLGFNVLWFLPFGARWRGASARRASICFSRSARRPVRLRIS